jgi:hypothetical protein
VVEQEIIEGAEGVEVREGQEEGVDKTNAECYSRGITLINIREV